MPDISLVTGQRVVLFGASNVNQTWPHYFGTYLVMMNPDKEVGFLSIAQGGTQAHAWIDGSTNEYFGRYVRGLQPAHCVIQFSSVGALDYPEAVDALVNLADNHVGTQEGATKYIVGPVGTSDYTGNSTGLQFTTAIEARIASVPITDWFWAETESYCREKWTGYEDASVNTSTSVITTTDPHGWADGTRIRVAFKSGGSFPSPLEEFTDYYVRDATTSTFKLAATEGAAAIALTTTGSNVIVSRIYSDCQWPDGDEGHVSGANGTGWMKRMFDEWGFSDSVSQATINASTLAATSETDCSISNITANAFGGIDFDRLDDRLPLAIDEVYRPAMIRLDPTLEDWMDYSLTVSNLDAGTYDITINSHAVGSATHTELAAGWNMWRLTSGPAWDKGQAVLLKMREIHDIDPETLLELTIPQSDYLRRYQSAASTAFNLGLEGSDLVANAGVQTYLTAIAAKEAEIHAAAQPETLSFSLRLQGYTPTTGTGKRSKAHVARILAASL